MDSLGGALEKQLGNYELLKKIGKGGMGEVYLARNLATNEETALKVLPPELTRNTRYVERFRREARAVSTLDHPHIIKVYDIGEQGGVFFFSMEYLGGSTLRDMLDQRGRIPVSEAVKIITDIADALDFAHSCGIIHRDVKPDNIIADDNGMFKIMDFGIAHVEEGTRLTVTGSIMGTPEYMSPEQASGSPIDLRTDIYSLGVVFYELLTGQLPFSAETAGEVLQMHLTKTPESPRVLNPEIPGKLSSIISKMLEKPPVNRYASFRHVINAIGQAIPRTMQAAVEPPSRTIRPAPARKEKPPGPRVRERIIVQTPVRFRAALALSIAFNLVLFGYLLLRPSNTGRESEPMLPAFSIGGKIFAPPSASDETLYLGAEDGTLYACDLQTGDIKWTFTADDKITAAAVVDETRVYVGSWDQRVYCLDASDDGRIIWKVDTGGAVFAAPVLRDGILYACTRKGDVLAIDAETGTKKWNADSGGSVKFSPLIKDGILFVSSGDRKLVAYNALNGKRLGVFPTDRMKAPPISKDGNLFLVTFNDVEGRDQLNSFEINRTYSKPPLRLDISELMTPLESGRKR